MNPGASKRQKELARQEHQKNKKNKKDQRKNESSDKPIAADGEDPDIAGIIPGPQPLPEGF